MAVDDFASPRAHEHRVRRTVGLVTWRQDVDYRADLRSIEAGMGRSADSQRDALAFESHDLRRSTRGSVDFLSIPHRDKNIAMLNDEQTDCAVLLGALLCIRPNALQ